jgi:hypothetical protein
MNYQRLSSVLAPIFLLAALLLVAAGIVEFAANVSGYTVLQQQYAPGRLLELAAMLAVIAIALLQYRGAGRGP